jgi:YidC/Oxa1 family membrane protein insertase
MDDQNKNLILAIALSGLVMIVWLTFFPPPEPAPPAPGTVATDASGQPIAVTPETAPVAPGTGDPTVSADAGRETPRVRIDAPRVSGSLSLLGGRVDDISLKDYHETIDRSSPVVKVLRPAGESDAQYVHFGWGSADGALTAEAVPGPNTTWTLAQGETLTPSTPVVLTWENGAGLTFTRTYQIDQDYMITVRDKVDNAGATPASLYSYAVAERQGIPKDIKNFFILHEGIVQMAAGELEELDYSDVAEFEPVADEGGPAEVTEVAGNGWIGFTDHYWQTVLIPDPAQPFTAIAKYIAAGDLYRTTVRMPATTVAPGASAEFATRVFAGAKEWDTIRHYENEGGVYRFIDSIDWGWFFFLTKPMFALLHWLHGLIGNMGWAIIALTFVIKAIVFPLAYKSYVSMAKMKELQPEMEKLKEQSGDDRMKLQQGMMKLYKDNKVNPASGCLPILIQIPIFFSLYKVIFVTLELRHAPWVGWLNDLSAPDPSSIYNLFGLLPWAPPAHGTMLALIFIGVLPIILGISMWLQQKLNPMPTDPTQAAIFAWMPWIFMFMLGGFASGLVLYWITNNTITFAQQYAIMTSHGHRPDLFGNIRSSFRRKPAAEGPTAAANLPKKPSPGKK